MNKNTLTITTTAKTVSLITVLLLSVSLVTLGCGGGGGGDSVVSSSSGGTQTGTLSGTIVLPGGADPGGALVIATRMTDDGTQPASKVRPKAGRQLDPKSAGSGSYVTVSDSQGTYTFPDIETGDYFVVASKGAYKSSSVARVEPKSATVVDLSLTPTGNIRGQVLLSGDDAASGDLSGTLAMVVGTSYIAATDSDGEFIISQIPVATGYQLMFTRPGYEAKEYPNAVAVTAAQTTTLDTVTMVVDSEATGSIGGVLLRPTDDDPDQTHEGILISITGTQFMAITDYDGNWIIHGVPAGIYSVAFGDLGGNLGDDHITLEGIEITAGELTEMSTMTLQPTGLEGKVTLQGGDAAVGAMVKIQELGSEGFAITSSEGDYYILGVDPGTYTVAAILDGYTPNVEENVTVEQGAILTLNFELVPSGTTAGAGNLEGTVYVAGPSDDPGTVGKNSPEPVPMGYAEVLLMGTNFIAIANEDGQYSMRGVPEGTYDLYVDGDEDGLDTEVIIKDIEILAGETAVQDATLIDSEPPEIWGMYGVQRTEEVDVGAGVTAMRLFFQQSYDVSEPIIYNVFYAPATDWNRDDWSQNQVMAVPEGDVGTGDDGEGPVFVDVTGLTAGTEYAFGVRPADYWGNAHSNDIIHFATPSGGQDIFPPKWDDDSRVGIQAAYALEDEPGTVAVEFESAHDGNDGQQDSPPVIYNIYIAPVNEFDEQDWSNNDVRPVPEDQTLNGSYYQKRVDIHYLNPGEAYMFGVRAADSAENPNEEQNTEIRVAIPAGGQAGNAHHLEFGRAPERVISGETWPGFGVVVVDEDGVIITDATDSITLGLDDASNLTGLDGTLTASAGNQDPNGDTVPGVAIFFDITYATNLSNLPERIVLEATADGLLGVSVEIEVAAPDSDGDGVPNNMDQSPNDASSATPPAATDTGTISVDVSDTQGAALSDVSAITADDPFNQAGRPEGIGFPDGLVFFNVDDIDPGATVPVTITFPTTYPDSAKYYKVDEDGFHEFQDAVINGNTVTLNLTDGGAGDSDGEVNGKIHDPGGVGIAPGAIKKTAEISPFLDEGDGTYDTTSDVFPGEQLVIIVLDEDNEVNDPSQVDTVTVTVAGTQDTEQLTLSEVAPDYNDVTGVITGTPQAAQDTGIFMGILPVKGTDSNTDDNGQFEELPGSSVTLTYVDPANSTGTEEPISFDQLQVQSPVVITEVMWTGTNVGPDDQWIEIQNLDNEMAEEVGGWTMDGLGANTFTIPTGTEIPADGFLVISKSPLADSALADNLVDDPKINHLVYPDMALAPSGGQIVLKCAGGNIMDIANASPWFAGDAAKKYAMERKMLYNDQYQEWEYTGPGTDSNLWYTCTAATNLDALRDDGSQLHLVRCGGTPGAPSSPDPAVGAPVADKILGLTEPPSTIEAGVTWEPLVFAIATAEDYIILNPTGQLSIGALDEAGTGAAGGSFSTTPTPASFFSGRAWFFDLAFAASVGETITVTISHPSLDPITGQIGITIPVGQIVNFVDQNLEAAIRTALSIPTADLTQTDLNGLTELEATDLQITDLSGLENCTSLEVLNLSNNDISDLSALSSLTNLLELDLGENNISDLSTLPVLPALEFLELSYNSISVLTPLSDFTTLTDLYLNDTNITDISALSDLTALETLYLSENSITDFSALASLNQLNELDIVSTTISSIDALLALPNLEYLYADDNNISSIGTLTQANQTLRQLSLRNNSISDISSIADLTALKDLVLENTGVTDISVLSDLPNLEDLRLSDTQVSDISALQSLVNLDHIDLSDTQVDDITALVNNTGLDGNEYINLRRTALNIDDLDDIQSIIARGQQLMHDVAGAVVVTFADQALDDVVRAVLVKPDGDIFQAHMETLTDLDASNSQISDISGLEYALGLQELNLSDNDVVDLTPLTTCIALVTLDLTGNQVLDISPLVANLGLGSGDIITLTGNLLSAQDPNIDILKGPGRGVTVIGP